MAEEFERRNKEDKPVVAICYDFDKTLSPDDMQAQGFIQSVGYDVKSFWEESNKLAKDNGMDTNLAYMYTMIKCSHGKNLMTKEELKRYGSTVKLFPGVKDWFSRIREYGLNHGVIVEYYIISSGLKEMIEGTEIAEEFERIYASAFYFDEDNVAAWPAQAVNYTNKTQFLFRIEKGILDINDQRVNDSFSPEKIRVPFRNIIYIGDSDTDIPCMKLVNSYGGHSIGVYNKDKSKVYKMIRENRIKYFASADYSENQELDTLVKTIIDRTVLNEKLEELHINNIEEQTNNDSNQEKDKQEKLDAIISLERSQSFANTHSVISNINHIQSWTEQQIEMLCEIGTVNSQVSCILTDLDVKNFYKRLLNSANCNISLKYTKQIADEIKDDGEIDNM